MSFGYQSDSPTPVARRLISVLLVLGACAVALGPDADSSPSARLQEPEVGSSAGSSVLDGVFTESQASRGEQGFELECASCHRSNEFAGVLFRRKAGETAADLYQLISTTMPEGNSGGLRPGEYADLVAFMFRMNDYPAGEDELPSDLFLLENIRIEAP